MSNDDNKIGKGLATLSSAAITGVGIYEAIAAKKEIRLADKFYNIYQRYPEYGGTFNNPVGEFLKSLPNDLKANEQKIVKQFTKTEFYNIFSNLQLSRLLGKVPRMQAGNLTIVSPNTRIKFDEVKALMQLKSRNSLIFASLTLIATAVSGWFFSKTLSNNDAETKQQNQ